MKLFYYPPNADQNAAIRIWKDCIKSLGIEILPLKKSIIYILQNKVDVVYLQWFENLPIDTIRALLMCMMKVFMIYFFKARKYSIYFVVHNKISHNKKNSNISKWLLKFILLHADVILILSKSTLKEIEYILGSKDKNKILYSKIYHLPHPSYIDIYPQNPNSKFTRNNFHIKEDDFVFLFLGQIRPYKNVELLIEAFQNLKLEKAKLIIAGKIESDEYKKQIELLIKNDNIITNFEFIEDSDISSIISIANIMVYPLDIRSSLNSGALYLSFSYGKTVIAPKIGTILDIMDYIDLTYTYEYTSVSEHFQNLSIQMKKCYMDYLTDNNVLIEKGRKLCDYMEKDHSIEKIKESYNNIFSRESKYKRIV